MWVPGNQRRNQRPGAAASALVLAALANPAVLAGAVGPSSGSTPGSAATGRRSSWPGASRPSNLPTPPSSPSCSRRWTAVPPSTSLISLMGSTSSVRAERAASTPWSPASGRSGGGIARTPPRTASAPAPTPSPQSLRSSASSGGPVRLGRFGAKPEVTAALVDLCKELHALPAAQRREALLSLSQATQDAIIALDYEWLLFGRPEQLAPPPPWRWWVMCGGRGGGKTR